MLQHTGVPHPVLPPKCRRSPLAEVRYPPTPPPHPIENFKGTPCVHTGNHDGLEEKVGHQRLLSAQPYGIMMQYLANTGKYVLEGVFSHQVQHEHDPIRGSGRIIIVHDLHLSCGGSDRPGTRQSQRHAGRYNTGVKEGPNVNSTGSKMLRGRGRRRGPAGKGDTLLRLPH